MALSIASMRMATSTFSIPSVPLTQSPVPMATVPFPIGVSFVTPTPL